MKLLLLSGGSGKRLWPLSNDSRSKQFLKVLKNKENEYESMVQRVWAQLKSLHLSDDTYIATGKTQVDMIQNQLGTEVKMIVEPERRDTFPAIALACAFLNSVEKVNSDEIVAVVPVDPNMQEGIFYYVKKLERMLKETGANIALVGVVPAYPSEKSAYIIPAPFDKNKICARVSRFTKEPTQEEAQIFINQGALWNCGVFAFRMRYILSLLKKKGFSNKYENLLEQYSNLPKNSFDYEVVEKESKITVLKYSGEGKDFDDASGCKPLVANN
ncbi:MAG: hypothetical protein GX434_07685 [Peptococcaceae bacterium]|nr:hypothetical protein [Peptococcaceae bacterium]